MNIIRKIASTTAFMACVLLASAAHADQKDEDAANVKPASFTKDGLVIGPDGWQYWVFVGSPLTPNALNNGKANFEEFHSVYMEPSAFDYFRKYGEWAEGTQMVKARTHILPEGKDCAAGSEDNGSCIAFSGRGYFNGEYSGLEMAVKDSKRFPDFSGGWAYYRFSEAPPWKRTAKEFPPAACNACHDKNADIDRVFTQYYPVLRANDPLERNRQTAKARYDDEVRGGGDWDQDHKNFNIIHNDKKPEVSKDIKAAPAVAAPIKKKQAALPIGTSTSPVPTDQSKLHAYLKAGTYKTDLVVQDKTTHPSAGPHINFGKPVKVFFSKSVADSLAAGNTKHPEGSAMVKEMYEGEKLAGWAVSVKTEDKSEGGKGWFWAEFLSTEDDTDVPFAVGNGQPGCFSCHASGKDFVLSPLPE